MSFSIFKGGQICLLLAFTALVSSCNKEEFFKAEEFLVGDDAFCFQEGTDLASCHQLGDRCRAAYIDADDETLPPEFAMCIADPDYSANGDYPSDDTDVSNDGSTTGSTGDGSSTGSSVGGSTTGSTVGGSTTGSSVGGSTTGSSVGGSTTGSTGDGSTTGSSVGGSTTGSTGDGSTTGSSTGGAVVVNPPLQDAYDTNCKNLDPKYLWTKKETSKNGTTTTSKVKVCHVTPSSVHMIVIACPALKAHLKDDKDYLGMCR